MFLENSMSNIPTPIFQKKLDKISWKKIYTREYGVQYSEMAILCLSPKASYHIPHTSVDQIVIPEGINTSFYIDETSWTNLVESLNDKYTSHLEKLRDYEKQFTLDGKNYLETARKISKLNLENLSDKKICERKSQLTHFGKPQLSHIFPQQENH